MSSNAEFKRRSLTCGSLGGPPSAAGSTDSIPLSWNLPRDAYISQAWYDREQEELFSRVWTFAALTSELAETGDYACVQVGHHPLVVVRGDDGQLRAFHRTI